MGFVSSVKKRGQSPPHAPTPREPPVIHGNLRRNSSSRRRVWKALVDQQALCTLPSTTSVMPPKDQSVDSTQANTLQSLCNQILEDIYDRDLFGDRKEAGLGALKKEYNQLFRDLHSLIRGPLIDPLEKLPAELWTEVLLEATNNNGANLLSTDALLLLTLVSNNWSSKILQSPLLWTNITIGRGEADAQAKLATALHLSGARNFHLTVNILPCQWTEVMPLLQPHAGRIKDIVLRYSQRKNYQDDRAEQFLQEFFSSLGQFSSLEIIQCRVRTPLKWGDIFTRSPNMACIYGQVVPFETIRSQMKAPLRACIINSQSSGVIKHIDEFTDLEEVSWHLKRDLGIRYGDASLKCLPSLKRIHGYGAANVDLSDLLRLARNLTILQLIICENWEHLYVLFKLFDSLPLLQNLDLTLGGLSGELSFPEIKPTRTPVQALKITIIHRDEDLGEKIQKGSRNNEVLFTVFPIHFPEVKSLSLESVPFGFQVSKYIASLSHLWSLHLSEIPLSPEKDASIESRSLQELHLEDIEGVISNELVSTIRCPLLSRLELDQDQRSFPKASHPWHNPSINDNVESLFIKSPHDHCTISRFNALRRLRIGARDDDSESGFLTSFIVDPEICPALWELEISFIPEWDLLFLMLERRNYLPPTRQVAPIVTLILPSPIAPTLLGPLKEILSGRFVERPSNLDLSFCGFMEAYFDPNISGCRRCIRSMMACTTAPRPYEHDPLIYGEMTLPSYSTKVPVELWEWMEQREDRLLDWMDYHDRWEEGGLVRYAVCTSIQMAQRPFIITGRRAGVPRNAFAGY